MSTGGRRDVMGGGQVRVVDGGLQTDPSGIKTCRNVPWLSATVGWCGCDGLSNGAEHSTDRPTMRLLIQAQRGGLDLAEPDG